MIIYLFAIKRLQRASKVTKVYYIATATEIKYQPANPRTLLFMKGGYGVRSMGTEKIAERRRNKINNCIIP
jgi:pyruvate dehydrogenase complex dehydrogenase (E1) component